MSASSLSMPLVTLHSAHPTVNMDPVQKWTRGRNDKGCDVQRIEAVQAQVTACIPDLRLPEIVE